MIEKCECMDSTHKANIMVSIQRLLNDLKADMNNIEEHKEDINRGAMQGISMSANAMAFSLRNRINSLESTINNVIDTPDCK